MSRRAILSIAVALAALAVACGGTGRERVDVRIGGLVVHAELVRTPEDREQGLSGRASLPADGGMLFAFEEERRPRFWMRGMRFPLDFIWISGDLRVVDTTENVPAPEAGVPPGQLPLYRPDAPVQYVLEVNAGTVERFGVLVGSTVVLDPGFSMGPTPSSGLFGNPSFENGREPWFSLETEAWGRPFSVSQQQARSGASSALLELRSSDGGATRIYGAVQEIAPTEFPEVLSGYYYVDRWEQGTPKQYLQFVVIVFEAGNIPPEAAGANNHQIRYILAGVDAPPIEVGNARFVMVGTGAPEQSRWVHFERNIRQDFQQLWGSVPEDFKNLRLLFEVRWDGRSPSDGPSAADVYYDDLYIGPPAGG